MIDYVWAAVGFGLLVLGAEALVHGGVAIARRLHVSPLLIGVTIVAYGTSTPELLVSVDAAFNKAYGIAVGNVVGSNILNVLLILGLTAAISPFMVSGRAMGRDGLFALGAAGLLAWIGTRQHTLGYAEGVLFLGVLSAMVVFAYGQERAQPASPRERRAIEAEPLHHSAVLDAALVLVGLGLLVLGAEALVQSSVNIARAYEIPEAIIGLTLVALGTSLPELVTSVVAAFRGNPDIALGNIIGSNIYNVLAILGVASLIGPVRIDEQILRVDIWVMLAATIALFVPLLFGNRMGRGYGLLLLAGYAAYVTYLAQKAHLISPLSGS